DQGAQPRPEGGPIVMEGELLAAPVNVAHWRNPFRVMSGVCGEMVSQAASGSGCVGRSRSLRSLLCAFASLAACRGILKLHRHALDAVYPFFAGDVLRADRLGPYGERERREVIEIDDDHAAFADALQRGAQAHHFKFAIEHFAT